jgi:hypothetical protein
MHKFAPCVLNNRWVDRWSWYLMIFLFHCCYTGSRNILSRYELMFRYQRVLSYQIELTWVRCTNCCARIYQSLIWQIIILINRWWNTWRKRRVTPFSRFFKVFRIKIVNNQMLLFLSGISCIFSNIWIVWWVWSILGFFLQILFRLHGSTIQNMWW